jgi:hypothetical protein
MLPFSPELEMEHTSPRFAVEHLPLLSNDACNLGVGIGRIADKYQDQDLANHAAALEERAQAALKEGKAELP